MWLLLGVAAIITALLNVIWHINGRDARLFRFANLALTALTLCAFYSSNVNWVLNGDLAALMDVVPTMSNALWLLTIAAILINGISLFERRKSNNGGQKR